MSITSQYIGDVQFNKILVNLNIEEYSDADKQDLIDRATADFESDLCERFVVPLVALSGAFSTAPQFARNKVLEALRCKIRQIISHDQNKNNSVVVDTTQKYIDLNKIAYKDHVKDLLDAKRVYGFKLNFQSVGSMEPLQTIGIGRANNEYGLEDDPTL